MKKVASFLLLAILVLCLVACFVAFGAGSSISENDSSDSSITSSSSSPEKTLTKSEMEELAEITALKKINSVYPFSQEGTRYKIGTINISSESSAYVNGQLYTYDKYGNFAASYTFTVHIFFDRFGNASATSFDYDRQ